MNSVNNAKTINVTGGHQYNWQHMIFVTKYRYKMFGKSKTIEVIRNALYNVAERYGMTIKELSFGDDYAHVHLEVSVPNTMSISYAVQLLKGYSSYTLFKEMPRHRLKCIRGYFWSAGYSNGSVGPRDENTLQNYIRKQDISNQSQLIR
jgi:REP element-mobilizing transposase RayT